MKKLLLKFKILFLLLFIVSCYTYKPVKTTYRLKLNAKQVKKKYTLQNYSNKPKTKNKKYYKTIFIVEINSNSVAAKINNKAIEHGLNREYSEAHALFKHALKEKEHIAFIYNNIGVTYELAKEYKKAFKMYSKACLLEPENEYFRNNFLKLNENN